MRKILIIVSWLYSVSINAQVGIGTTLPEAQLDIRASNPLLPLNSDGLLIPRIDEFPLNNPTPAKDGLLVYITGNGSIARGFYFWNGSTSAWSLVADGNWMNAGVNDIERQLGDVYIGNTNLTNNDLYISDDIIDWDNFAYNLDPGGTNRINEIQFDDGSAGDVSIYFSETNTGLFSPATDVLAFSTNGSESLRIDNNGNMGLGTANPAYPLEIAGSIVLEDSNAPILIAGHSGIYSNSGELRAVDSSGNETVISPHYFGLTAKSELMAWSFYSENKTLNRTINVDMLKTVRLVEMLSGEKLVYQSDLEGNEIDDTNNTVTISKVEKLKIVVEQQQKEIDALKAMVEKLIEKNE